MLNKENWISKGYLVSFETQSTKDIRITIFTLSHNNNTNKSFTMRHLTFEDDLSDYTFLQEHFKGESNRFSESTSQ